MIDFLIIAILLIIYIGGSYFLTRYIRKRTITFQHRLRRAILSFTYALLFGIGLVGGGGDTGFALPSPIIIAAVIDILLWTRIDIFITHVIIPFTIWWTLIFVVMLIDYRISSVSKRK